MKKRAKRRGPTCKDLFALAPRFRVGVRVFLLQARVFPALFVLMKSVHRRQRRVCLQRGNMTSLGTLPGDGEAEV